MIAVEWLLRGLSRHPAFPDVRHVRSSGVTMVENLVCEHAADEHGTREGDEAKGRHRQTHRRNKEGGNK